METRKYSTSFEGSNVAIRSIIITVFTKINFSEYMNHGWNALCILQEAAFSLWPLIFSAYENIM